jgi:hypothetical protein
MEKAIRKGSTVGTTAPGENNYSSMLDSLSTLPDELRDFPPSEEFMLSMVEVYFRNSGNWSLSFTHEGLFRARLQEQKVSKHLLYAVCAASLR